MKNFLIAAAGLSAIAAATPAAAQYYPGPNYGYNQPAPYGYNQVQYRNNGYNQQALVRSYVIRADQLRQRIDRLDGRDRVSEREARQLRAAAIDLQNRTRAYARNGLSNSERRDLDNRFARLQQRARYEVRDGNNRYGNGWGQGVGGGRDRDRDGVRDNRDNWIDRDRDGRDDRREDDRGRYPG